MLHPIGVLRDFSIILNLNGNDFRPNYIVFRPFLPVFGRFPSGRASCLPAGRSASIPNAEFVFILNYRLFEVIRAGF